MNEYILNACVHHLQAEAQRLFPERFFAGDEFDDNDAAAYVSFVRTLRPASDLVRDSKEDYSLGTKGLSETLTQHGFKHNFSFPGRVRVMLSDAVLAEISLRSPRKIFIFIIKKYIYRIKVSKKNCINFDKKLHWSCSAVNQGRP